MVQSEKERTEESREKKRGRCGRIRGGRDFCSTSQSTECTSVRKSAFVSNNIGIKLIHPERERNIQRGGREEEDERD